MTIIEILILVGSGFAVGFINTIAGGATVISLAALMVLGLPFTVANATHRVAALFQTAASTGSFLKQKALHPRTGLKLGIPVVLGSLPGAWIAVVIDDSSFEIIAGVALLLMLITMLLKPGIWMTGKLITPKMNPQWWHYLLLFGIGFYGGLIYIGIGYVLLAGLVLGAGFDLLRANALKAFIVMLYIPATLVLFILADLIHWQYALVISVGQAAGAVAATKASFKGGNGFIRWFMVVFILITLAELFHFTDLRGWVTGV
jgi:uncharacterized protein